MKDYDIYKGLYCSLCKTLGKRYGFLSRMILNYDLSFFALLMSARREECCGFKEGRCPFNPSKKCKYTSKITAELEDAADACVILSYYKIKDNINDSGILKKIITLFVLPFFYFMFRRAKKKNPEYCRMTLEYTQAQAQLEKAREASIDKASEPSARLLAGFFSHKETDAEQKRVLERFGYCLGRWIYLIDACDDYEDDKKKGCYNPYIFYFKNNETYDKVKEKMSGDLNLSAAGAAGAYELMEIKRFDDIIANIIYDGIFNESERVLKKENHNG